jgi:hypothetical protein
MQENASDSSASNCDGMCKLAETDQCGRWNFKKIKVMFRNSDNTQVRV